VQWSATGEGRWCCTIVEHDRTGLLATVAGALALVGVDIESAVAFGHPSGLALEVFGVRDHFERLATPEGRSDAATKIAETLRGELPLEEQLTERSRRYRPTSPHTDRGVRVLVDTDASESATVVEVHAPDDVGLLARIANVFVDLDLDVTHAIVSTSGERVVDVFYLDDPSGTRFADRHAVASLRATLLSRLTAAVTLDER
jgi:[protein-PII] uridylyltransferase